MDELVDTLLCVLAIIVVICITRGMLFVLSAKQPSTPIFQAGDCLINRQEEWAQVKVLEVGRYSYRVTELRNVSFCLDYQSGQIDMCSRPLKFENQNQYDKIDCKE